MDKQQMHAKFWM